MATPTIEYSHLNKFLSSVGLGLMVVSVLAMWAFLESFSVLTIDAEEIAALTPRAQEVILTRQWQIQGLQWAMPPLAGILFVVGLVLAVVGTWRWRDRQNKDDAALDEEHRYRRREFVRAEKDVISSQRSSEIDEALAEEQEEWVSAVSADGEEGMALSHDMTSRFSPTQGWPVFDVGASMAPSEWTTPLSDVAPGELRAREHTSGWLRDMIPGVSPLTVQGITTVGAPGAFRVTAAPYPTPAVRETSAGAAPGTSSDLRSRVSAKYARIESHWLSMMMDAYSTAFTVRHGVVERAAGGQTESAVIDVLLDPPESTDWSQLAIELKLVSSKGALFRVLPGAMRQAATLGAGLASGNAYSGTGAVAPAAVTALVVVVTRNDLAVSGRIEREFRHLAEETAHGLAHPVGVLVLSDVVLEELSVEAVRDRIAVLWTGLSQVSIVQ